MKNVLIRMTVLAAAIWYPFGISGQRGKTVDKGLSKTASSLEDSLLERANSLYGAGTVSSVSFGPHKSISAVVRSKDSERKVELSPFDTSRDFEKTKEMSMKGDVASGVILLELQDALFLDTSPCESESVVFTFHPVFSKKRLGKIACHNRTLDKYLISQR